MYLTNLQKLLTFLIINLLISCSNYSPSIDNSNNFNYDSSDENINDSLINQKFNPSYEITGSFIDSITTKCVLLSLDILCKKDIKNNSNLTVLLKVLNTPSDEEEKSILHINIQILGVSEPLSPYKYYFNNSNENMKGIMLKDSIKVDDFDPTSTSYFEITYVDTLTNKVSGYFKFFSTKGNGFIGNFSNIDIVF
jgi:hypothetical protein